MTFPAVSEFTAIGTYRERIAVKNPHFATIVLQGEIVFPENLVENVSTIRKTTIVSYSSQENEMTTIYRIHHRPLTEKQTETLNSVWDEVQDIIGAEITRRKLWHVLEEIMGDAITRTTAAVGAYNLTTPEEIKSRARSCALDAIRIAARSWKNTLEFFRDAIDANWGIGTHNGKPVATFRGTPPIEPLERKISRRNFRPELFYAAITMQDEQPFLQFASYGPSFIE